MGMLETDEFDAVLNMIGMDDILDCSVCEWEGTANETDDGYCPDCCALVIVLDDEV